MTDEKRGKWIKGGRDLKKKKNLWKNIHKRKCNIFKGKTGLRGRKKRKV